MGGINCQPGQDSGFKQKELEIYTDLLANYCENMFGGIAAFYLANASIEKSIQKNSFMQVSVIEMKKAITLLKEAQSSFGSFASYAASKNLPHVDYSVQLENIDETLTLLNECAQEMINIPFRQGQELQNSLWRNSKITIKMTDAAHSIHTLFEWQSQFALSQNSVLKHSN